MKLEPETRNLQLDFPFCPDQTISPIKMDFRRAEPIPFYKFQPKGGKEMIKINLLPGEPGAEIWRKLEKAVWMFWFLLPFAVFLWEKLAVNSK